jgi:hypothetical protein
LKQVFIGIAIVIAGIGIIADSNWVEITAVCTALGMTALGTLAGKLQTKFERSYTRH